jgi:hypothetical protein
MSEGPSTLVAFRKMASDSEWSDVEADYQPCRCLFSEEIFDTAQKCFEHDRRLFGFDFAAFRRINGALPTDHIGS